MIIKIFRINLNLNQNHKSIDGLVIVEDIFFFVLQAQSIFGIEYYSLNSILKADSLL